MSLFAAMGTARFCGRPSKPTGVNMITVKGQTTVHTQYRERL